MIRIHTGNGGGYGDPRRRAARARARRPAERLRRPQATRAARSTALRRRRRVPRRRPVHARDHPGVAAGDQRRDVRRAAQDGDERDHLRGARHGHRRSPTATATSSRREPASRRSSACSTRPSSGSSSCTGRESAPGDVFVTNDPFYGGVTHLNDVVLAMPVFPTGELVAWTANIAHWNDVGGMVPGSISTEAREIFQEGLRLPAVKLVSEGAADPLGDRDHEGEQPAARLPARRHVGGDRGGACRRAADRRALGRYGPTTFAAALQRSWTTASRSRGARSASYPGDVLGSRRSRTTARSTARRSRSPTTSSSSTCATTRTRTRARTTLPRRAVIAAQILLMNLTDPHGVGERGALPAADACSPAPARSSTRCRPPRSPSTTRRGCGSTTCCGAASRRTSATACPPGTSRRSAGRSSAGRIPTPGRHFTIVEPELGGWGGSAIARRQQRDVQRRSTATRSTAPPRSRRPATACTSTGSR